MLPMGLLFIFCFDSKLLQSFVAFTIYIFLVLKLQNTINVDYFQIFKSIIILLFSWIHKNISFCVSVFAFFSFPSLLIFFRYALVIYYIVIKIFSFFLLYMIIMFVNTGTLYHKKTYHYMFTYDVSGMILLFDHFDFSRSDIVMLPDEARGPACRFRWWQPTHSGAGRDMWAIDGISINNYLFNTINLDMANYQNDTRQIAVNLGTLSQSYCGSKPSMR